jgi:hypothetical protein
MNLDLAILALGYSTVIMILLAGAPLVFAGLALLWYVYFMLRVAML